MSTALGKLLQRTRWIDKLGNRLFNGNHDQYIYSQKMPLNPNIVIIGGKSENAKILINKYFQDHQVLKIKEILHEQSKEDSNSKRVAKELLENIRLDNGKVLIDFPTSVSEAEELDIYLNGVNIAISFEGESLDNNSQSLLKYYQHRGLLMQFKIDQTMDQDELKNAFHHQFVSNIKL